MIEVEKRIKVNEEEFVSVKAKLDHIFVRTKKQKDIYYYPPHKDFLMTPNGREYLRLRENDEKAEFEHKNVIYKNGKMTHSIENSVAVSNPEKFIELLGILGFRVHIIVDKLRDVFEDEKFIITLDHVNGLGHFIEVEMKQTKNEFEIENANKECIERMHQLGIQNLVFDDKGYVRLLEDMKSS